MKSCKKYTALLKALISGEISEADKEELLNHIDSCAHCRELYELNQSLDQTASVIPDAETETYAAMRRNVLRAIRYKEARRATPWYADIRIFMQDFVRRPLVAYGVALILLVTGFFIGREKDPVYLQGQDSGLIKQISYSAAQNTDFEALVNSPYIFSDVKIKDMDRDLVTLSFNVQTHVEITRPKDDLLVREVVAQSILNQPNPGYQLKTIAYSENLLDPKIRDALIYTMNHDSDYAVRLKAIESLTRYPNDPRIQEAFLDLLRGDYPIQMRLMAIDYLTKNKIARPVLAKELGNMQQKDNTPVLLKANQYLQDN